MNIAQLDAIYKLYRFEILPIKHNKVRAYAHITKYFSNADIIILEKLTVEEKSKIQSEIEQLGFAVSFRAYSTLIEAEENLFDGFFDIKSSLALSKQSYLEYKDKISKVILGQYEYINSNYVDVEKDLYKTDSIVDSILFDMQSDGPTLVVLEAAAGFGKTSTAYEVLNCLIDQEKHKIPLFAELSRNRQATIFKYVLFDEINRRFTNINLELVNKHIIEGRIPLIIDGFDELLRSNRSEQLEDKFQDAEPMLETIRDLLHGQAKILLTTRRTAIFAGDDFHNWVDKNSTSFNFRRYSISTPSVSDWINPTREKELDRAGLNIKSISNPLLLAYLRGMSEEKFRISINDVDLIIGNYIDSFLEREMQRQELIMSVDEQKNILKIISDYFVRHDVTSENKETVEKVITDKYQTFLFSVADRYGSMSRPTSDQIVSKLTMHAFLDRKGSDNQKIGFVNDFILGTFVGENLLEESDWICTERFLDFIVTAYSPRSLETKSKIYDILNKVILDYLTPAKRIYVDNYLFGSINHDVENEFIEDMEFRNAFSNDKNICNTIFSNCEFYNIEFDLTKLSGLYFINCLFFKCKIDVTETKEKDISFTNCRADPDFLHDVFKLEDQQNILQVEDIDPYEKHVLETFWPSGKDRLNPNKRIDTVRLGVKPNEFEAVDRAIDSLMRKNILTKRKGWLAFELNLSELKEIKRILGRL
jgi:hypothetical protein